MKLFVYGSLMFPDVLHALLHRAPETSAATLAGYRRGRLHGKSYPGITPASDHMVQGALVTGLNDRELCILDAFEDDLYDRITVQARALDGSGHKAFAYCVASRYRRQVAPEDWDVNVFRDEHLTRFLARISPNRGRG